MKMLVINAGSSSLKFTVFDLSWMGKYDVLASGQVECIGLPNSQMIYRKGKQHKVSEEIELSPERKAKGDFVNYDDALNVICEKLMDKDEGVLLSKKDIIAIGHRAVHGGEKVTQPVIVTDEIKAVMRECFALAPLHNPPNLSGIEACERTFPGVPNVAIFDTAFHQTMEPSTYLYAIPYELYKKYGIRKYGFHGTSHHYVAKSTANYLKVPFDEMKLITCHLGNGCSMAAISKGKSIDTSMGMTPLEGLVMGTRCGDIDPAIPLMLIEKGIPLKEVDKLLNKKSGLLGVAGINTSDMRDVIQAAEKGNAQAAFAIDLFARRIVKYIGAYFAELNGADAVVFTGGIGENSAYIREKVLLQLSALNIDLDKKVNNETIGTQAVISTRESKVKAIVMPTNEELMIANQSIEVLLREGRLKLVAV